ncbi:MAG: cytoplasmic protein [Deltaproteobacteria bacterium]|nr:cytoplasmic protein [Deltaproteobacteria bacterium]MBW2086986.1 cytoplasmic protein [Deltaproteobacteria bacterium]
MADQRPPRSPRKQNKPRSQFTEFDATELFCPTCQRPMPVRKRLLLVLPEGDKYEYLCVQCGTTLGNKIDKNAPDQVRLII